MGTPRDHDTEKPLRQPAAPEPPKRKLLDLLASATLSVTCTIVEQVSILVSKYRHWVVRLASLILFVGCMWIWGRVLGFLRNPICVFLASGLGGRMPLILNLLGGGIAVMAGFLPNAISKFEEQRPLRIRGVAISLALLFAISAFASHLQEKVREDQAQQYQDSTLQSLATTQRNTQDTLTSLGETLKVITGGDSSPYLLPHYDVNGLTRFFIHNDSKYPAYIHYSELKGEKYRIDGSSVPFSLVSRLPIEITGTKGKLSLPRYLYEDTLVPGDAVIRLSFSGYARNGPFGNEILVGVERDGTIVCNWIRGQKSALAGKTCR